MSREEQVDGRGERWYCFRGEKELIPELVDRLRNLSLKRIRESGPSRS